MIFSALRMKFSDGNDTLPPESKRNIQKPSKSNFEGAGEGAARERRGEASVAKSGRERRGMERERKREREKGEARERETDDMREIRGAQGKEKMGWWFLGSSLQDARESAELQPPWK